MLWDDIKGRVEKAGVRPWVRFRTPVRNVAYSDKTGRFTVIAHDLRNGNSTTEEFDHVVVATGHFSTPTSPSFPGSRASTAASCIRTISAMRWNSTARTSSVIGTSYSAEDVGSQCYKYGAKSITSSYRSRPMGFKWPANWEEKPLLQRVENRDPALKDGTSKEIYAIILCTGYLHYFPFLPDSLRLKTDNRMWPLNLYPRCGVGG